MLPQSRPADRWPKLPLDFPLSGQFSQSIPEQSMTYLTCITCTAGCRAGPAGGRLNFIGGRPDCLARIHNIVPAQYMYVYVTVCGRPLPTFLHLTHTCHLNAFDIFGICLTFALALLAFCICFAMLNWMVACMHASLYMPQKKMLADLSSRAWFKIAPGSRNRKRGD